MAKKQTVSSPEYKITMVVGDKTYTKTDVDPVSALLSLKPEKINVRAVFRMEYDGKQSELLKNAILAKGYVANKMRAFYLVKNLITLLK